MNQSNANRTESTFIHSDNLSHLNLHHSYSLQGYQQGEFPVGFIQTLKWKLKSKLVSFLSRLMFPYLEREQLYMAHLVRHLNELSLEVERFRVSNLSDSKGDIQHSHSTSPMLEERVKILESVVSGLERIISSSHRQIGDNEISSKENEQVASTSWINESNIDYSYLLLENRYRGSEEEIKQRLRVYPPLFSSLKNPVLEIGAGRGELQQLFREANIPAYGVELDRAMVERCLSQGLSVKFEDGISHLQNLPDSSLGGVIAIQVVEHLSRTQLDKLLSLILLKVEKGGVVVFETINTESILALAHNYFRDPTHVAPLHPDTMSYILQLSGFEVEKLLKLSPYPQGALLAEIAIDEEAPESFRKAIEQLNNNFRQLNGIFYGFQDYAVVARVP